MDETKKIKAADDIIFEKAGITIEKGGKKMNSIFHRVSIRKYTDQKIEEEKIMQMLRAAMAAPSACNQQPWEFYVVKDKEKIQELSTATPYSKCAAGAPVVIVPVYRTEGLVAPSYAEIDLSIAQQNIWLETDEIGLGGVWLGIAPIEERMKEVEEIVGIPEDQRAFAIFPLGYPAEERAQQDRFDESRIHFDA